MDAILQATDEELLVAVAAVQERINRESASLVALVAEVAEVATRGLAGAEGLPRHRGPAAHRAERVA